MDATEISFVLHFLMGSFQKLQIQFWMWWTVYALNWNLFFFCPIVIVALEVIGLLAAVITSYPKPYKPFSDVHSPHSVSTGPLISQAIVAVGQIGLEAHHCH